MRINKLLLAIGVVVFLNLGPLVSPFTTLNWDSETHMFFADHFQRSWFNPWEPRWYGGFYVYASAPLTYQLVAIAGIGDLERGYRIVQLVALVLLPASIYFFTKEVFGKKYAGWASLLVVGVSGTYVVLYTFGQLPTFVAFVLAIMAAGMYSRFLRTGNWTNLIGWFALAGGAVSSNHYTVILCLPLVVVAVTISYWLRTAFSIRAWILKPLVASIVLLGAVVLVIAPFWWWYFRISLPQTTIPHPTRSPFLQNPDDAEMYFWDMYGGALLFIPLGILALRKVWKAFPLVLVVLFLVLMGLGGNTDIPTKILGGLADVFTFDRFSFWAAMLTSVLGALFVANLSLDWRKYVLIALSVVLLFGIGSAIQFPNTTELLKKPLLAWEEDEVVKFLDDHTDWNYLTLGLGEPEVAKLSRLTNATSIDGFYNQARSNYWLRISGVGTLDSTPLLQPSSPGLLEGILSHPQDWSLRWVICDIPWAEEWLRQDGWQLLHPIGSSIGWKLGDANYSDITVWEAPIDAVAEMTKATQIPPKIGDIPRIVFPIWWGVVPLSSLVVGLLTLLYILYRRSD